jgi:hypothetical protein
MKLTTVLAKHFDVNIVEVDALETRIELFEKGDDNEPIGSFVVLATAPDCYQWRNVYSKVESGTAFTDKGVRAALKLGLFNV